MWLKSSIILLSVAITTQTFGQDTLKDTKLFLVGGGLKTCSTMSKGNCSSDGLTKIDAKTSTLYQLSPHNIAKVFDYWPSDSQPKQRTHLQKLLTKMAKENSQPLDKRNLRKLWRELDSNSVIDKLADAEYYMMLDALEVAVVDKNNNRKKELVNLMGSKNPFSIEIFKRFVSIAKQKSTIKSVNNNEHNTPKILVVTASARDTFEAVDFYLQAFTQAGAEAEWLSIDGSVNYAWQQSGSLNTHCENLSVYREKIHQAFKREEIYPDHAKKQHAECLTPQALVKKIKAADGLFINGGDQSKTLKAFKNSDHSDNVLLKAIKQQLQQNLLVVGGTSAGTAVMSGGQYQNSTVPMITNGRSEVAIVRGAKADQLPSAGCNKLNNCTNGLLNDDLTFNSHGGLGLFSWGIMDTHFSERGRQGRLAQLTHDTKTPFAFGVDEATSLEVSWTDKHSPSMNVVGQGGVFIVQPITNHTYMIKNKYLTHYLTRGDSLTLTNNSLSFQFAKWKINHQNKFKKELELSDIFNGTNYRDLAHLLCLGEHHSISTLSSWKEDKDILLKKTSDFKQSTGHIKAKGKLVKYCSYTNVALTI